MRALAHPGPSVHILIKRRRARAPPLRRSITSALEWDAFAPHSFALLHPRHSLCSSPSLSFFLSTSRRPRHLLLRAWTVRRSLPTPPTPDLCEQFSLHPSGSGSRLFLHFGVHCWGYITPTVLLQTPGARQLSADCIVEQRAFGERGLNSHASNPLLLRQAS